jgi:hypothetical protein
MKTSPKLVFALLAAASCAAGAQTYSSDSDQARRERNREEALAQYRGSTPREEAHDVGRSTRHGAHKAADSTRHGAHKAADSTRHVAHKTADEGRRVGHKVADESRRVGHKVAVKARESTARADAKFGTVQKKDAHGEASNPTGLSNTAANGPKP